MYSGSFRTVFDLLKQGKGFVFDVETLGFRADQPLYSASFVSWMEPQPKTFYVEHSPEVLERASAMGRAGYTALDWTKLSKSSYADIGKELTRRLNKSRFIVGHNIAFDFSVLAEALPKEQFYAIQKALQSISDPELKAQIRQAKAQYGAIPKELQDIKRYKYLKIHYPAAYINAPFRHQDTFGHVKPKAYMAYSRYLNYIQESQQAFGRSVIDTLLLSRIAAGFGKELGLLETKLPDALIGLGSTLEGIATAIGIDTKSAHTEADVLYNKKVAEFLLSGDIDKLAEASRKGLGKKLAAIADRSQRFTALGLKGETESLFRYLEKVGSSKTVMKHIITSRLSEVAREMYFRGGYPIRTIAGRRSVIEKNINIILGRFLKTYHPLLENIAEEKLSRREALIALRETYERIYNTIQLKHLASRGAKDYKYFEERAYQREKAFRRYQRILANKARSERLAVHPEEITSILKSGTPRSLLIGAGVLLGLSLLGTTYSLMKERTTEDNPTRIEGLHPGDGVNKEIIDAYTDFGSPLKMPGGISKAFGFVGRVIGDTLTNVAEHSRYAAAGFALGIYTGYNSKHKSDTTSLLTSVAIDLTDDILLAVGGSALGEKLAWMHPLGAGMFGFGLGKLLGARISGKDDDYNTIEGLRHGGVAEAMRKRFTDFGSGYKGPNPQLSPSYNEAEDVPRYEIMRASKIGLSEEELYEWAIKPTKEPSEYVAASASAGTALHQYMQAIGYQQNPFYKHEILVVNRQHGITGHIDELTAMGIGDIKTVNSGIFNAIAKEGRPKPSHYAQVQFYMGTTGVEHGYIKYVDRDNPLRQKVYQFDFDPIYYENLLAKVERVRARVLEDIATGRLDEDKLPKTASIERLEKDALEISIVETPEYMAMTLDERRRIFKEEMDYLRSVKRGMPSSGPGAERIQKRNQEKRHYLVSTQGIGLQTWYNRSKHHVM